MSAPLQSLLVAKDAAEYVRLPVAELERLGWVASTWDRGPIRRRRHRQARWRAVRANTDVASAHARQQ